MLVGTPFAFGLVGIGETEDVVLTSLGATARENKVSVGKFLHLGLITAGDGAHVATSEEAPGLAEVIGIEHPVGSLASIIGRTCTIEAVVVAKFGVTALMDFSAAYEPSSDSTVLRIVERCIDEFLIQIFGFGPGLSVVV